jgi:type II secretory pathway pseudopilin PulG
MEVLVAVVVFAISVVGLVALESRSIETQKSARELRAAERIAQEVMSDLMSRGFMQLIAQDFTGAPPSSFPYDDSLTAPALRLRALGLPPADVDPTDQAALAAAGHTSVTQGQYIVFRTVDFVSNPADPPSNPPLIGADEGRVSGLTFDVVVIWLDYSNPTFPPPEGLQTTELIPDMTDPLSPEFRPYVSYVRLRNVRTNDAVLSAT